MAAKGAALVAVSGVWYTCAQPKPVRCPHGFLGCDPVEIVVRTNIEEVLAQFDRYAEAVRTKAVPRALNKLRDQAQVAGFRLIGTAYGVKRSDMLQYGRVTYVNARSGDTRAAIVVAGITFPLWLFQHRQTREGVLVTLRGRQFLFPHAFEIRSRGTKVFARGSYTSAGGQGSRFKPTGSAFWNLKFGRGRFPITLLRTMSPRGIFRKDDVVKAMMARVKEQAGKVLLQEIRFATGGAVT